MQEDPIQVQLLGEALDLLDEHGHEALEGFLANHPQHEQELRARLERLQEVGLLQVGVAETRKIPDSLGEFALKERIGSGGMGVVYRAEQTSLHREVALKLIRPEHLFFPESRERFQREIEAIAQLQHPTIVRVYEAGEEQGLPYFAMECVHGVSLSRVLKHLRSRSAADLDDIVLRDVLAELRRDDDDGPALFEPEGKSWVEVCCRWARDLATALAYAHARGVLHRDVKPSNIMLTWDGRVLLLDFGLASTGDSDRITKSGAALGSLAYMAPEQMQDSSRVSERTDVYGLGVTLYELLALRHPYEEDGSAAEVTRRRILEGHPQPLRSRRRSIPWDAETVCLSAMDRDPVRRYANAAEFARDLDHVLHFRPIEARRPGMALRLRRLTQRHPAASVGLGLGLLLLVGGPLGLWRAQVVKTRAIQAEQHKTLAQSELAEARFETSVQLIADVLLRIGYVELLNVPNAAAIRHQLLRIAEESSQSLLQQIPDHPLAREMAARVNHLQGQLLFEEMRGETARPLLASAAEVFADLWQTDPANSELAQQYSLTLNLLGSLDWIDQDRAAAEETFYTAMDVVDQTLEVTNPDSKNIDLRRAHLSVLTNLATMLLEVAESRDEGRDLLWEALPLAEQLAQDGASPRDQNVLVTVLNNLAPSLDDREESLELHRHCLEICRSVLRQQPHNRKHRFNLSLVLSNTALILQRKAEPEARAEAGEMHDEAMRRLDLLCRDYPDQTKFAQLRVRTLVKIAILMDAGGDPPEQLQPFLEECLDSLEPFCTQGDPIGHHDLSLIRLSLYGVLLDLGQMKEAEQMRLIAVQDARAAQTRFPAWEERFDRVLAEFEIEQASARSAGTLGTDGER